MVMSSIPTRRDWYWDGSLGGSTTLVIHQAMQANSASYPEQDGKQVPANEW